MNWSVRPFVRILFFYIIGIMAVVYFPAIINIDTWAIWIILCTILISAIYITSINLAHKYNWLTGLVFGLMIILVGVLVTSQKSITSEFSTTKTEKQTYLGNIINNPSETNKAVKAIVAVESVETDSIQPNIPQKVLCYFAKDSLSIELKYGDVIVLTGKLSAPVGPLNPGEFDFNEYLKQNGINYTSYLSGSSWKLIGYEPVNPIIALAGTVRSRVLELLQQNGLSGDNYAVAAAVLLGYDDSMESELKQDYIMAGAMHILCVSGLHVGIIYLVVNFLLGFMINNRTNNILKAALLLLTVWAYATLTGLSPSVQRASIMISVFIIGELLIRNRDTYNTLAISALLLLLINPYLLFNVGFQLSYAAVIGIVTFHQPIYKLIYIKNFILDKVWSISVLSFAAQLATFPIATYYFHFFPPWFWLTNLFTFPLSFLIIATGLIFVLTAWIPLIAGVVGFILSGLVFLLNYSVGFVKYLPFPGIEDIHTSLPMLIGIYITLIMIYILFTKKRIRLLLPVFSLILIISFLSIFHRYEVVSQKRMVIYSINLHRAYEFIDGKNQIILADSSFINNDLGEYQIRNSRSLWGLSDNRFFISDSSSFASNIVDKIDNFILFDNLTILISNGETKYYPLSKRYPVDMLIISGRKRTDIDNMHKALKINKVIIDSSVPSWKRKNIISTCSNLGLSCYDVNSDGALIVEL